MTERLSTHTAYILVLMGILCQIFVLFMSFFFFFYFLIQLYLFNVTSRKIQKSCCHLWLNGLRFSLNKLIVFECLYVLCSIVLCLVGQTCSSLCNPMDHSPLGSSVHGVSPGKNTGVDCHALLEGIFPNQGQNPGLLHCRWIITLITFFLSSFFYNIVFL